MERSGFTTIIPLPLKAAVLAHGICCVMSLHADTLVSKTGRVYIGAIQSKTADQTDILAFGKKESIPASDVESSGSSNAMLAGKKLFVTLKDGSMIQGKLRDFSEEVGLYLDSEIGAITIPDAKIAQIDLNAAAEPATAGAPVSASSGMQLKLGIFGSASYPFISDTMKQGFGGGGYGEISAAGKFVSGFGVAATFEAIAATQTSLRFSETSIYAYARKVFLPLGAFSASNLKKLGLAVTLGFGGGYMHLSDSRSGNLSPNGEAYALTVLKTGAEYPFTRTVMFRFDIVNTFRIVAGKNLWKPGIEMGAVYAF